MTVPLIFLVLSVLITGIAVLNYRVGELARTLDLILLEDGVPLAVSEDGSRVASLGRRNG